MKQASLWTGCILLLLFIWERGASVNPDIRYFVSSPSASFSFAVSHYVALRDATFITGLEAVLGFIVAILISGLIMLVCLYWPAIFRIVLPIFVISQILPMITLAPLFIVLFGMALISKIAMVALMSFFPIFINFASGIESVSRQIIELLYIYDTRPTFKIFKILLPLSLPHGFAGLKVGTTMAMMGAIVAEFMGANDGLGKNLYLAPKSSQAELMICSIALVMILGFLFYSLIALIERYVCGWYIQKEKVRI